MPALLVLKRVDICNQVTANAERIYVFLDAGVLAVFICKIPVEVTGPNHRSVRNANVSEDLVVEATLTH